MYKRNIEISVLTGFLSLISETTISTDEITCFCKKSQSDFAKNNFIRKSFLLQATFTRDIVAIFLKNYCFPQLMYLHAHFQT